MQLKKKKMMIQGHATVYYWHQMKPKQQQAFTLV